MATLQGWLNRRCACVHPDCRECLRIRENRRLEGLAVLGPGDACDCLCHDLDPSEDDDE